MAIATELIQTARPKSFASPDQRSLDRPGLPKWAVLVFLFGLFLTARGYHSFDGDQAYRLPLLYHWQDPTVYASDHFVRAFDEFNPHGGYLALLYVASLPFGVAAALFILFTLTFGITNFGIDRLARALWPDEGSRVSLVAIGLVLLAKSGNIGTNHLFEATLLDRLVGFALGWVALSSAIESGRKSTWTGAVCLSLAALIHPSVGLQLALTLAATWAGWGLLSRWSGVRRSRAAAAIGMLGLAMIPAVCLMAGQGGRLFPGLPVEDFRSLAVMIQGPQHMLPSTWRTPQWLAWFCYPILGSLALGGMGLDRLTGNSLASRCRFMVLLVVNFISLGLAYLAIECVGDLRVTLFQPFRMATLARGLCLVAISGRLVSLWRRGDFFSRARVVLVGTGLTGDWATVVMTAAEVCMSTTEWAKIHGGLRRTNQAPRLIGIATLVLGLVFLFRHDTESGHVALLAGLGTLVIATIATRRWRPTWTSRRFALAILGAWAVPMAAMIFTCVIDEPGSRNWTTSLVERCRFAEVPTDDLERLAVWCRANTPPSSRFIGPPGPKTFRLWSRRPLAFNRAASPYHAAGLADWSSRYRDHVGFDGSTADFARAYLADRHSLEQGYERKSDDELASLARRQGATYVLASASRPDPEADGPLERIKVEGRYAVYRVRTSSPARNLGKKFVGLPFQSNLND